MGCLQPHWIYKDDAYTASPASSMLVRSPLVFKSRCFQFHWSFTQSAYNSIAFRLQLHWSCKYGAYNAIVGLSISLTAPAPVAMQVLGGVRICPGTGARHIQVWNQGPRTASSSSGYINNIWTLISMHLHEPIHTRIHIHAHGINIYMYKHMNMHTPEDRQTSRGAQKVEYVGGCLRRSS